MERILMPIRSVYKSKSFQISISCSMVAKNVNAAVLVTNQDNAISQGANRAMEKGAKSRQKNRATNPAKKKPLSPKQVTRKRPRTCSKNRGGNYPNESANKSCKVPATNSYQSTTPKFAAISSGCFAKQ